MGTFQGMETFEKIDKLLRLIRDKDLPFGGIQLIFFGDFFSITTSR